MVAVGFVVEGGCERIVLRSPAFQTFLETNGIKQIGDVIDMDGKGNLKQSSLRMQSQVRVLRDAGAKWIVVLRDLDEPETVDAVVRASVDFFMADDVHTCFAVQELEAWFLADSDTLSHLFNTDYACEWPELIKKPSDYISSLRMMHKGKGIGDKKGFASAMINNGFSIQRAAAHERCPSARYFLDTLTTLASAN